MAKKENPKIKSNFSWSQLEIILGIILALSLILSFFQPGITGFVSAGTYNQPLEMKLNKSTSFMISATQLMTITAFKLTGKAKGGTVRVFLDNLEGQKLLVYENLESEKKGLGLVTGMAISDERFHEEPLESKILEITPLESFDEYINSPAGETRKAVEEAFEQECRETCFIDMKISPANKYKLIVFLEKGASLDLNEIVFTASEE